VVLYYCFSWGVFQFNLKVEWGFIKGSAYCMNCMSAIAWETDSHTVKRTRSPVTLSFGVGTIQMNFTMPLRLRDGHSRRRSRESIDAQGAKLY
jgi:hypothetical protein